MLNNNFYNIDLNLLRTFIVLMQEKNMRKASERLFVSQPAISQTVQKLRDHFDDELFVKVRNGIAPTPFAINLERVISPHLNNLELALGKLNEFSPEELSGTMKIALSPHILSTITGTLFTALRHDAPNLDIELVNWGISTSDDVLKGDVFYGVHYDLDGISKEIARNRLTEIEGRAIVRQEHPVTESTTTPQSFDGVEIASQLLPGFNDNVCLAANILNSLGCKTRVGFRSEVLLALIDVVRNTDLVLPHSNLFPIKNFPELRSIAIQINNTIPRYSLYSYTHTKDRNSPTRKWLDSVLIDAIERQILINTD
ncbi:LysR family transcriptional regulator [Vibrio methylphosphonaticus]|uniref:LysR family transcriptional regulator n=1 Tax=Vibrio methylphosphonaticus TaxID=2946866 RepID=UPI002029DD6E|nr:LysR family transcriptional regulator [Vibrio methylphosphonaticus]MCL9775949.1 LysR family transcriptional regulator [Vibrio methylphosphonaticus]